MMAHCKCRKRSKNLTSQLISGQITGRGLEVKQVCAWNYSYQKLFFSRIFIVHSYADSFLRNVAHQLPREFVDSVDRRLGFNNIPTLLSHLERHSEIQRFNISKCAVNMKVNALGFKEMIHLCAHFFLHVSQINYLSLPPTKYLICKIYLRFREGISQNNQPQVRKCSLFRYSFLIVINF